MAEKESSGVEAAFREINGLCSEAYAFAELVDGQVSEPVGLELLLSRCLKRFADAYGEYEHQLLRAGVDVDGSEDGAGCYVDLAKPAIPAGVVLGGRSEAEGGGEAPLQSGSPN